MATFKVYGIATMSKYLGEVEADTKEQAEDKAWKELGDEMYISICHQCSRQMGDTPEISKLQVEEE
jgi:ERCC4-related helicase